MFHASQKKTPLNMVSWRFRTSPLACMTTPHKSSKKKTEARPLDKACLDTSVLTAKTTTTAVFIVPVLALRANPVFLRERSYVEYSKSDTAADGDEIDESKGRKVTFPPDG